MPEATCSHGNRSTKQNTKNHSTYRDDSSAVPLISSKSKSQVKNLDVETEIYHWVQVAVPRPSSTEIRKKAVEMYRARGHENIQCSYGWYRRWCERFQCGVNGHDDSDSIVLSWLLKQYDDNILVSYADLRLYGQNELKRIRPDFKASPGWATRFLKRYHIFLNWDGTNEEKLPPDLESESEEFLAKISCVDCSTTEVGCMDEIPLSFAGSKSKAASDLSAKSSRLKKISIHSCDATVILSLRADGCLLPPMIVVKAQNACSVGQVYSVNDNPVIVFYSNTTDPSVSCLEKWLELVWLKNAVKGGILLWDSYHLHGQMDAKCMEFGVKAMTFPAGCACKLQPLNSYARVEFTKLIDSCWEEYLQKNSKNSEIKSPSPNEIVEWVTFAYKKLTQDPFRMKLRDSFKTVKLRPRDANV